MCRLTVLLPLVALAVVTATPTLAGDAPVRGFLEPVQSIRLSTALQGQVTERLVAEGDHVAAGDVVLQLDDATLRASLAIAEHEASRTSDQKAATAEHATKLRRVETLRKMATDGHSGGEELARAEADLLRAEAELEGTQEQQTARRLEVDRIKTELARRQLTSPIDGIVTRLLIAPGETVGTDTLATIVDVRQLRATFHVPAERIDAITGSLAVIVDQPGRASRRVNAATETIASVIDAESGTVRVTVLIDNADGRLLAGSPGRLELPDQLAAQPRERR